MQLGLRKLLAAVLFGSIASWSATAEAVPPWRQLKLFRRVEADPNADYRLTTTDGPWMILAVTFTGETAADEARSLVYELRKQHKLNAYVHAMDFDFSNTVDGRGVDAFGRPKKMRYRRNERFEEVAVLVGDYPSYDDTEGQSTLERVKYLRPDCLETGEGRTTSRPLAALRLMQQALLTSGNRKKSRGPMGHAFMTTNPMLPKDYFVPKGLDPLVVDMNRGVKYSLLDCPAPYSVKVATFKGEVIIDPKRLQKELSNPNPSNKLQEAAEKAHRLTEALRAEGVEAYEFHDRYSSMVTIGSFASVGTPRRDGKIEIDRGVLAILNRYGSSDNASSPSSANLGQQKMITTKAMDGIPFDPQPIPIEVPRQSISSQVARGQRWLQ